VSERVTFHVFEEDGTNQQVGESTVDNQTEILTFIHENVTKYHSLRVVGEDDSTLLEIVDRSLIFPITENHPVNNKWSEKAMWFVPAEAQTA